MSNPTIDFGLQFFPDIGPDEKSAQAYWNESLYLVGLADELGYGHIRTVEHYFNRYGGYGRHTAIIKRREKIKKQTIQNRRLNHQRQAA